MHRSLTLSLSFSPQVHKIINGSLAQRDGRIEKGDRILSINGILLKGKTHKEALEIMKTPTPEVLLVVFHNLSNGTISAADKHQLTKKSSYSNFNKLSKELSYSTRELGTSTQSSLSSLSASSSTLNQVDNFKIYKANLIKDGAALGFVLEGGKDSPLGDKPLTIKRIFKGNHTLSTHIFWMLLLGVSLESLPLNMISPAELRCALLISFLPSLFHCSNPREHPTNT